MYVEPMEKTISTIPTTQQSLEIYLWSFRNNTIQDISPRLNSELKDQCRRVPSISQPLGISSYGIMNTACVLLAPPFSLKTV